MLLLLTLAAVAVRAAFVVLEPPTRPIGDERTWTDWARILASPEKSYSALRTHIIFHPPVYAYFLAVPWGLTGGFEAAKWAQVLLGSLLVPAVALCGARAFGAAAGLVAGGIAAFYPELVWFSAHFWSETLFTVLLWWGLERLLASDAQRRVGPAALAGLLWGFTVLTRETVLYFLPVAAAYLAFAPLSRSQPDRGSGRDAAVRRAAAFLLAAFLVIAPWTYRNWRVFHALVPVSTAGGQNLFQGNTHIPRDETYVMVDAVPGRIGQYRYAMGMGIQAIRERQPWWIFEKLRDEMPKFWEADSLALIHIKRGAYGEQIEGSWRPRQFPAGFAAAAALIVLLPYLAVMAGLVSGLARISWSRPVLLLLGLLLYYNALHVVTHGFARYRLPIMPIVFLFAASAWCARTAGPLRGRRRVAALVLAAVVALVLVPSIRMNLHHPAFGGEDGASTPAEESASP